MPLQTTASAYANRPPRCLAGACLLPLLLLLASCTGIPKEVQPVQGFDAQRYLGKWYEIARLDHSFERDLQQVTAEYSPGHDGAITVLNRGYNRADGIWKSAQGLARFVDAEDQGHLKVSFFGPFYGSYIVFELDEDYQYAFVSGFSKSYLWFLSRTPTVSPGMRDHFVQRATELGFPVEELIFVEQTPED